MYVIWEEGPGKAAGLRIRGQGGKPVKEILSVGVGAEHFSAFNSSDHDVVNGTGCVYASFSRHVFVHSRSGGGRQVIYS